MNNRSTIILVVLLIFIAVFAPQIQDIVSLTGQDITGRQVQNAQSDQPLVIAYALGTPYTQTREYTESCNDLQEGKAANSYNYFVKSNVHATSVGTINDYTDYCISSTDLREYACSGWADLPRFSTKPSHKHVLRQDYNCIYGCENGICLTSQLTREPTTTPAPSTPATSSCGDADRDGWNKCAIADCNDNSATVNPGAKETCNGKDDNCDSQIDEGGVCPTKTYYCDADKDTYKSKTATGTCNAYNCIPSDCLETAGNDCNDDDPLIKQAVAETCNGKDDNCDSQIDEGSVCPTITYYCDKDLDTSISKTASGTCNTYQCKPTDCQTTAGTDCNDDNAAVKQATAETLCTDGLDNDCDTKIDAVDTDCAATTTMPVTTTSPYTLSSASAGASVYCNRNPGDVAIGGNAYTQIALPGNIMFYSNLLCKSKDNIKAGSPRIQISTMCPSANPVVCGMYNGPRNPQGVFMRGIYCCKTTKGTVSISNKIAVKPTQLGGSVLCSDDRIVCGINTFSSAQTVYVKEIYCCKYS